MKIIGGESIPDTDCVRYKQLKEGDLFSCWNETETELHFYIKTNNKIVSIAVDLMTGECVVFDDYTKVAPLEMEATIKRRFGNCINENCKYFHLRMIDGEPCKSCSRNYKDLYERKREEG